MGSWIEKKVGGIPASDTAGKADFLFSSHHFLPRGAGSACLPAGRGGNEIVAGESGTG